MAILFDAVNNIFHLKSGNCSYIFGVNEHGLLQHIYWGETIELSSENGNWIRLLRVKLGF